MHRDLTTSTLPHCTGFSQLQFHFSVNNLHPRAKREHFSPCVVNSKLHTHTHPFNGPLSRTTQVSRYQKGKTNLEFTEARDSEWQWHQLGHMQVCTSLQTDNHASTPPLSFYRPDALPAAQPTVSKHWSYDLGKMSRSKVIAWKTDMHPTKCYAWSELAKPSWATRAHRLAINFYSPQPDTDLCSKKMNTTLVCGIRVNSPIFTGTPTHTAGWLGWVDMHDLLYTEMVYPPLDITEFLLVSAA